MSFTLILWLFTAGVLLHNLEEAIWLPQWSRRHGGLQPSPFAFRFATVIVSLLFVAVAALASLGQPHSLALYAATGLMGVVALNTLFPHVAMTLYNNAYMPGLATALLMVLPLALLGLWRAIAFDVIDAGRLAVVIFALMAALPGALWLLFRLGGVLQRLVLK